MKNWFGKILFLFIVLVTTISLKAQKTLEFKVYTITTTVGDMDGFGTGNSDPLWHFRIEDYTYGNVGLDTIRKPENNCYGTSTEDYVFFSEQYQCDLPAAYQLAWGAYEEDNPGWDAKVGTNFIPFFSASINPNQTTWTTLYSLTDQVTGTTCSGPSVTWGIHIQYRVLGSFSNNVSANFTLNPKNGCAIPHTVFFTDQSTNPDTWFWDFGDGNTSTAQNPIHTYTTIGTFPVSLTITDTITGCTDVHLDTVVVTNPIANFSAPTFFVCRPLTINFTNSSNSSFIPQTFSWDFGDGTTSTVYSPSHVYDSNGTFTVSLTVTDSIGCFHTKTEVNYIQARGPDPDFGISDTNVCVGQQVDFSDSTNSIDPIDVWSWDFGDGNTSSLPNPSHTYTAPGLYYVSLYIAANGCSRTKIDSVLVTSNNVVADFDISDSTGCLVGGNFLVNFTDQSINADTWSWDFGDLATSSLQNPSYSYSSSGILYPTLIIRDTVTGCSDTITDTVHIGGPVANASATPLSGCNPLTSNFSDLSTSPFPLTWDWSFADGSTSALQNPTVTFNFPGIKVNKLVITDSLGCKDSIQNASIQNLVNGFKARISMDDSMVCISQTVQFADSSLYYSPASSWVWDFGDGNTSGIQHPTHIYSAPGKYYVQLIVRNFSCADTVIDSITVFDLQANFSSSVTSGCYPLPVNFTDLSTGDSLITSWSWDFGNGSTATIQNPSYTYDSSGAYTVTLLVSDTNGCSASETDVITVQGAHVKFGKSDSVTCASDSVYFYDSTIAYGAITSRLWDFGDGNTSTAVNPVHKYSNSGFYYVTLTISDVDGCTNTYTDSVIVYGGIIDFDMSDSVLCLPASINFTNQSSGSFGTWLWDFGDGNTDNSYNTNHTYIASLNDSVTLYGYDSFYGCVDSLKKPISAYKLTSTYIINNQTGITFGTCYHDSMSFEVNSISSPHANSGFYWDLGDGNTSTDSLFKHKYTTGGYYQGVYIETDSLGCADTSYFNVVVNQPIIKFDPDEDTGCIPFTVNFTDNSYLVNISPGIGFANYAEYDYGDGNTANSSTIPFNPSHTYTTPGTYQVMYLSGINSNFYNPPNPQCYDTLYTSITVLPTKDTILLDTICESDVYISPSGDTISSLTGTYYDTVPAQNTCDSAIQINLFVRLSIRDTINDTICENDSLQLLSGNWVKIPGFYDDTLTSLLTGCDSILTTNLFVKDTNHVLVFDTICENDTYLLPGGSTVSTAGVYYDTLINISGCDSIITTNLYLNDTSHFTLNDTICSGDTYTLPGGSTVSAGGTYYDTIGKQLTGCDSIITIILFEDTAISVDIYDTICANEFYQLPGGSNVNTTGTYIDILAKQSTGCDSIVITHLQVNDTSVVNINDTICQGQTYTLPGGGTATTTGQYMDTLTRTDNNCDSIVIVDLFVYSVPPVNIDTAICDGDSVLLAGSYRSASGTFSDTLTSALTGCDSVINFNLTVNPNFSKTESMVICAGDSVFLEGAWQKTAGTYNDSLLTSTGCDSILQTILYIKDSSHNKVYDTICQGQSIFLGGANQTTAGNYFDTLVNAYGCDSILETELYVSPIPVFTITPDTSITIGDQVPIVVNAGYTYQWSPSTGLSCTKCSSPIATPTQTTTYQVIVSRGGCDSIATITITVQEEAEIFVPTIFSPNGDNNNDIFKVRGAVFTDFKMVVYDRWGEKVFETDNYTIGWDGTFRGKDCMKGAYGYIIEGVDQKGRNFEKKGNITLIR